MCTESTTTVRVTDRQTDMLITVVCFPTGDGVKRQELVREEAFTSLISSYLIRPNLQQNWVRYETTQFTVAATIPNEVGRAVLIESLQVGPLHGALSSDEMRWDEMG